MSSKRIITEFNRVSEVYDAEMVGDNMRQWQIALPGPDSTPYYGYTFLLQVDLPSTYPFTGPSVQFRTLIYHPNVSKKGEMCLNILNDWKPKNTILDVLAHVSSILVDPDANNPLEPAIAAIYISHRSVYETQARNLAQKYAV